MARRETIPDGPDGGCSPQQDLTPNEKMRLARAAELGVGIQAQAIFMRIPWATVERAFEQDPFFGKRVAKARATIPVTVPTDDDDPSEDPEF